MNNPEITSGTAEKIDTLKLEESLMRDHTLNSPISLYNLITLLKSLGVIDKDLDIDTILGKLKDD